jgi:NitT/TauT family transport system permease protein
MKKEIFLGPVIAVILWQLLTMFKVIDVFFIPTPVAVVKEMVNLVLNGKIALDILVTLYRMLAGFAISILIGIPIGLLMGYSEWISNSLEFIVDFLRSIPGTALIPLFMFFFGIGDKSKIAMGAFASCLVIIINSMYGVSHGNKTRRMVAQTIRVNQLQMFTKVIFPDALPEIFIGLRVGLSMTLVLVVVSEMFLGTTVGLGHRIYDAQLLYRVEEMYSTIILAGILGYTLNKLFVLFEKRIVHWTGR